MYDLALIQDGKESLVRDLEAREALQKPNTNGRALSHAPCIIYASAM